MQNDIGLPAKYGLLTLSQLLQAIEPTYAAKRVVDTVLARSVLLLLNGPWIERSLSLDDILVFCKMENDEPRPIFDKVFYVDSLRI